MISICLTKFFDGPWEALMMKAFKRALTGDKLFCNVEEIYGYPEKHYDIIFLIGIRPIVKLNLDHSKIRPYCKHLVDMGDHGMDPRRSCEDAYLYFIPSKKKLYKHHYYIPKFVLDDYLYPAPSNKDKLNIFVDHFAYSNIDERDRSIKTIRKIFSDLRDSEIPLNIFYHTSKGIELNRLYPEIPKKGVSNCALFLPFEKISEYYRKTDIFIPTHKESQGMLAQEIGACGGITVLQDWMYPKFTLNQFVSVFYNENQKIDFIFLKKILEKHSKEEIRKYVLKHCGFSNFKSTLIDTTKKILN